MMYDIHTNMYYVYCDNYSSLNDDDDDNRLLSSRRPPTDTYVTCTRVECGLKTSGRRRSAESRPSTASQKRLRGYCARCTSVSEIYHRKYNDDGEFRAPRTVKSKKKTASVNETRLTTKKKN